MKMKFLNLLTKCIKEEEEIEKKLKELEESKLNIISVSDLIKLELILDNTRIRNTKKLIHFINKHCNTLNSDNENFVCSLINYIRELNKKENENE